MLTKYLVLLYILISYLIGFANIGVLFLAGFKTKNPKLRSAFILFLSFGLYLILVNITGFGQAIICVPLGAIDTINMVLMACANSWLLISAWRLGQVFCPRLARGWRKYLFHGLSAIPLLSCLIELTFSKILGIGFMGFKTLLTINNLVTISFGLFLVLQWWHKQKTQLGNDQTRILKVALTISSVLVVLDIITTGLTLSQNAWFGPMAFENLVFCLASLLSIYLVADRYVLQPKLTNDEGTQATPLASSFIPILETNRLRNFGITERERQIIALVCRGCSNRDIANTLFIEPVTVKNHLYKIYQKTRVNNRVGLNNLYLHNWLAK